jgi:uncharacterized LabA/DUF88 family protein
MIRAWSILPLLLSSTLRPPLVRGFSSSSEALKYAILVDAENAHHRSIPGVLQKISSMGGVVIVKRAYGDFENASLFPWKRPCAEHSFSRVQASQYVIGKSTTDLVLTMDAIEISYTNPAVNAYAIVSSDSDFTGLAERLRKGGKYVIGFGRHNTLAPFVNACDTFAYVEQELLSKLELSKLELLHKSVNDSSDTQGWASLGRVGTTLENSKFNCKECGYKTLISLFKSQPSHFEVKTGQSEAWVRCRNGTFFGSDELARHHLELLRKSVNDFSGAQGWAYLGNVGGALGKSKFNCKEYGYKTLARLFHSQPSHFEVKTGRSEAWVRCRT